MKVIKIILIVFAVLISFKLITGGIKVVNPFGFYPSSKNRFFLVKVNNQITMADSYVYTDVPIIPFVFYLRNKLEYSSMYSDEYDHTYVLVKNKEKVKIDIKTYECYYQGVRNRCSVYDKTVNKEKKFKINKMRVSRMTNPYETLYEGKYIKDITKYIDIDGAYEVTIYGKYNLTKFETSFYIYKNYYVFQKRNN